MEDELKKINNALIRIFRYRFVPVYIKFLSKIPLIRKISPFIFYILIGLILFIPYILVKSYSLKDANNELLSISICIAIISAAGVLLVNGYYKVVDSILLFPRLFTERRQFKLLIKNLYIIFKSPFQYIVPISFGLLGFYIVYSLDPLLNGFAKVYFFFLVFISFFMAGFGLWLAITSIYWIYCLQDYGSLNLFPIPGKTLALKNISKLLGMFSLSFSLVVVLFLFALFSISWQNELTYKLTIYLLVIPFVVFIILFFTLPQYYIKNIVQKKKLELIQNLEDVIKSLNFEDLFKRHNHADCEMYFHSLSLHNELASSPIFLIDLGTYFKFLSSIAFPIIVFLFETFIVSLFR